MLKYKAALKFKFIIFISSFTLVFLPLSLATEQVNAAATAPEKFEKETSIYWTLKIASDRTSRSFEGKEIDRELAAGIVHSGLGIRCGFDLTRKVHGYDPKQVTYARDEESSMLSCDLAGYKVSGKTVTCAKGRAKNKVGSVYSDTAELAFAKDGRTYGVRLSCAVK